jgi:hypothetical protein
LTRGSGKQKGRPQLDAGLDRLGRPQALQPISQGCPTETFCPVRGHNTWPEIGLSREPPVEHLSPSEIYDFYDELTKKTRVTVIFTKRRLSIEILPFKFDDWRFYEPKLEIRSSKIFAGFNASVLSETVELKSVSTQALA